MVTEMNTVFIAGSIAISRLDARVKARISNAVDGGLAIVVGDADGADTSIQQHLVSIRAENVTVYCSGDRPRNNVGEWPVEHVYSDATPGTEIANYGLMIWDTKSTGTLSNVIALLEGNKKTVVFVNKAKEFVTVSDGFSLKRLLENMSVSAKEKADRKIGLSSKVASFNEPQYSLI